MSKGYLIGRPVWLKYRHYDYPGVFQVGRIAEVHRKKGREMWFNIDWIHDSSSEHHSQVRFIPEWVFFLLKAWRRYA